MSPELYEPYKTLEQISDLRKQTKSIKGPLKDSILNLINKLTHRTKANPARHPLTVMIKARKVTV
jgi:hypothetical protein